MPAEPDDAFSLDAVHHPHDALFRRVFGRPMHAASEIVSVLAPEVVRQIDLDSLTLVPGSHVDDELRQSQSDLLFTAQISGHDAFVYVLIEHQSRPDPLMAFRILKYVVRIWDDFVRSNPNTTRLPAVLPIVVYQGSRPWTGSTNIADIIDASPEMSGMLPHFAFILDDLREMGSAQLRKRPLTAAARFALVLLGLSGTATDPLNTLRNWIDDLRALWADPGGPEILTSAIMYLHATAQNLSTQQVISFMQEVGPEAEEAAMTIAEQLHAEGRVEGRAEGRVEGQAKLLETLLTRRFGPLDDSTRQRIQTATSEDITLWSSRLIDGATTIDQVLADD